MAKRYTEQVSRVIYIIDAKEVQGRIIDSLRDEVGDVFDDSTVATILPDGTCHVTSEYVSVPKEGS